MGTPFQDIGGAGAFVGKRQVAGHYGNQNRPRCEEAKEDYAYVSSAYRIAGLTVSGFPGSLTSTVPLTFDNEIVQWTQPIYSAKFSQTKQAQQTEYVFALTQVMFTNTIDNIYPGNNQFPFIEYISGVATQLIATLSGSTIPVASPSSLADILENAMNAASNYPNNLSGGGIYEVFNSSGTIVGGEQILLIVQTNLSGQTIPINFRVGLSGWGYTSQQFNSLILTGMESSIYIPSTSGIVQVAGSSPPNLWAGLDTLFITCDCIRYPYIYQPQALTAQAYRNGGFSSFGAQSSTPVLAQIPFDTNSQTQQVYQIMNLQWHETIGFPFEKPIEWTLTDSNFNPVYAAEGFAIYLTIKMKPVGLEVLD